MSKQLLNRFNAKEPTPEEQTGVLSCDRKDCEHYSRSTLRDKIACLHCKWEDSAKCRGDYYVRKVEEQ